MKREQGSETVEIFGGPYDGAVGVIIGREQAADGAMLTQVRLPDGTVVTIAEKPSAEDETPRETGS